MDELDDGELPVASQTVDTLAFRGLPRLKRVLARERVMENILDHLAEQLVGEQRWLNRISDWKERFCGSGDVESVGKFLVALGKTGLTVGQLIEICECAHVEDALLWLKRTEPCSIVEDVPADAEIRAGGELGLSCVAGGFPFPEYQWIRGTSEIDGATSPVLRIGCMRPEDAGEYCCLVRQRGRVRPDVVTRRVLTSVCVVSVVPGPPKMRNVFCASGPAVGSCVEEALPHDDDVFVVNARVGDVLRLRCDVYAWPSCRVVWARGGPGAEVVGAGLTCQLELKSVNDGGYLVCRAENEVGAVASPRILVQVTDPLTALTRFSASVKVAIIVETYAYSGSTRGGNLRPLKPAPEAMRSLVRAWESVDFTVLSFVNLSAGETLTVAKYVAARLPPEAYVLFFFSGHGYESCGRRFLVGVDGRSLLVDDVVNVFQAAKPSALVLILDCCRVRMPCPRDVDALVTDSWSAASASSEASSDSSNSSGSSCLLSLAPKGKRAKNLIVFGSTGRESLAYERATRKIVDHLTQLETLAGGFTFVLMGLRVKVQTPDIVSYLTENRSWIDPIRDPEARSDFVRKLGPAVARNLALRHGHSETFRASLAVETDYREVRHAVATFCIVLRSLGGYGMNAVSVDVQLRDRDLAGLVRGIIPVQPPGVQIAEFQMPTSCSFSWSWVNVQAITGGQKRFGFELRTLKGTFYCDLEAAVPDWSEVFG